MANLKDIIAFFEKGKTPKYEEFKESWTSFWHKSEKLPIEQIFGLQEEIAKVTTNNKGYHTSLAELNAAYPQATNKKDFFAWVGSPYPGTVWVVKADKGVWIDTGEVPPVTEIDLEEYAKKVDLAEFLEKSDFIAPGNGIQSYTPDMAGTITSGKANSLLVNSTAIVENTGFLNKISLSVADNGNTSVHVLKKEGSVFTSLRSKSIAVSAGIKSYAVSLAVEKDNYIGIAISTTNASVKLYQGGQSGYWGGQSGTSFTLVGSGLICYGFEAAFDQEAIERPKEIEAFKAEILLDAQKEVEESTIFLKRSDLVDGGELSEYAPDLNGGVSSQKGTSMLINALARTQLIGTLHKVTINTVDSGKTKVHLFSKVGNVFTSVASQELYVTAGINSYLTNLEITSEDLYVGLELAPTFASLKFFAASGREGYYGGANGTALTFVSGALICYGFTIKQGEGAPRPQEVENFKAEILQEVNGGGGTAHGAGHQLYAYNMKEASPDFTHTGWAFSENGATQSILGIDGRLFVKKQINIETKIQRCIATLYNNTNLVLYTEGKEESSLRTAVSVNVTDKTINIHEIFSGSFPAIRESKVINFPIVAGRKYIIEMYRLARANGIRIIDTLTGSSDYLEVYPTQAVHGSDREVYVGGLQYDQFGIFCNSGTFPIIHELSCGYFGAKNPLLYISGDSLTYGYGTNDTSLAYAHMIGALTSGDYVVSARGGGRFGGVLEKIQTECAIIKPKYVMVTIGTNAAASVGQLQQLIDAIKAIGSIPIINCIPCGSSQTATANTNILSMGVYGCRFDIATAIDPTAANLQPDKSLFIDSVHPNVEGFKRMANRVRIDLPFLI